MSAVLAAVVGGALAILGGLAGAFAAGHRELDRWKRDTQLRISTELLGSLQQVVRRMMRIAYLQEKPATATSAPAPSSYHDAVAVWNSSLYAALLVSPPKIVGLVQDLDREVDRLIGLAMERQWSRLEFREERRVLGRLAAAYLNATRAEAGWSPIQLKTVWSWDEAAEAVIDQLDEQSTAYLQPAD